MRAFFTVTWPEGRGRDFVRSTRDASRRFRAVRIGRHRPLHRSRVSRPGAAQATAGSGADVVLALAALRPKDEKDHDCCPEQHHEADETDEDTDASASDDPIASLDDELDTLPASEFDEDRRLFTEGGCDTEQPVARR